MKKSLILLPAALFCLHVDAMMTRSLAKKHLNQAEDAAVEFVKLESPKKRVRKQNKENNTVIEVSQSEATHIQSRNAEAAQIEENVHARTEYGLTPLMIAARKENKKSIESLITQGADINATANDGSTALMIAIEEGNTEAVEVLLAHNVRTEVQNCHGFTALMLAVVFSRSYIVSLLLAHGADPLKLNFEGSSAWNMAQNMKRYDILDIFEENVQFADNKECTLERSKLNCALFLSAEVGCFDALRLCLERPDSQEKADPNVREGKEYNTVLHRCMTLKCDEEVIIAMVKLLLQHGADQSLQNRSGYTPLMLALKYARYDVAQVLLEAGAPVNARDARGTTALYQLAENQLPGNEVAMINALIAHGADINLPAFNGVTPLMIAVHYDKWNVIQCLLAHGANRTLKDNAGKTALGIAIQFQKYVIGQRLGAPVAPSLMNAFKEHETFFDEQQKKKELLRAARFETPIAGRNGVLEVPKNAARYFELLKEKHGR